jgi:hypothetical protein
MYMVVAFERVNLSLFIESAEFLGKCDPVVVCLKLCPVEVKVTLDDLTLGGERGIRQQFFPIHIAHVYLFIIININTVLWSMPM